jgi:muramoyltetrapeptide carboxypeptidase
VSLIRPSRLAPGARAGVCAPAGPVDPDRFERGLAALRELGFDVRVTPGARGRRRFHSGPLEQRAAELQSLLDDPTIDAVFFARGGAGSFGLLRQIDLTGYRRRPKPVVGYSDLTFVHLLLQRAGYAGFHGPLVAIDLAEPAGVDEPSLRAALFGGAPYASEPDEIEPLRAGEAEGVLLGGCLSILASACGTPWALAPEQDTILFLEDLDEPPYRIERMLTQLLHAGAFERVRGIVLGDFKGCSPRLDEGYSLEDVILETLAALEVPIALGLSSGHTSNPNVTLPLGVRSRLECREGSARFEVLEEAAS